MGHSFSSLCLADAGAGNDVLLGGEVVFDD